MSFKEFCEYLVVKFFLISKFTIKEIDTSINIPLIESNLKKLETIYLNFAIDIPKIDELYKNFAFKFKDKFFEKLKIIKDIILFGTYENSVELLN